MFSLIASLLSFVAVVLAFAATGYAIAPLLLGLAGVLILLVSVRSRRYGPVPELSSAANDMLARFGHYYAMPYAGTDVSSAASALAIGAMIVGVIALLKTSWLVVLGCAVVYFSSAALGRQFNPSNFLLSEEERAAHQEIISFRARSET